jgi:hypothetical protein
VATALADGADGSATVGRAARIDASQALGPLLVRPRAANPEGLAGVASALARGLSGRDGAVSPWVRRRFDSANLVYYTPEERPAKRRGPLA